MKSFYNLAIDWDTDTLKNGAKKNISILEAAQSSWQYELLHYGHWLAAGAQKMEVAAKRYLHLLFSDHFHDSVTRDGKKHRLTEARHKSWYD